MDLSLSRQYRTLCLSSEVYHVRPNTYGHDISTQTEKTSLGNIKSLVVGQQHNTTKFKQYSKSSLKPCQNSQIKACKVGESRQKSLNSS